MTKIKWSIKKVFIAGLSMLILGSCFLGLGYIVGQRIDRNSCYERIGKDMHISPTYIAISNAINIQVQEKVHSGMRRDEVMFELSKISPIVVAYEQTSDGEKLEFLTFKVCPFPENGIGFLAVYLKDGTLKSIRQYVDD